MSEEVVRTPEYLLGIGAEDVRPLPFVIFKALLKSAGIEYELEVEPEPGRVLAEIQPEIYEDSNARLSQLVTEIKKGVILQGRDRGRGEQQIKGIDFLRQWLMLRSLERKVLEIKLYDKKDFNGSL